MSDGDTFEVEYVSLGVDFFMSNATLSVKPDGNIVVTFTFNDCETNARRLYDIILDNEKESNEAGYFIDSYDGDIDCITYQVETETVIVQSLIGDARQEYEWNDVRYNVDLAAEWLSENWTVTTLWHLKFGHTLTSK